MGSTQRKECLLKVSECFHFLHPFSCRVRGRAAVRCNQVCLICGMCDRFWYSGVLLKTIFFGVVQKTGKELWIENVLFCQRLWSPYIKSLKKRGWRSVKRQSFVLKSNSGINCKKKKFGPNLFDPKLTWAKLFQTEDTQRLACLLSFWELILSCLRASLG